MKQTPYTFILITAFLFVVQLSFGQTTSGMVVDSDGTPLIGASVVLEGTNTGTLTDVDGNFSVETGGTGTLVISYIGYKTLSVDASSSSPMSITLSEDAVQFEDVVVTATRQPVRKIQTTTAINSIGSEELEYIAPESVAEALVNAPGVTVENSQGRKSFYNIRGFPSGNTYVTTLLDGLPLSGFASRSAGTNEFIGLDKNVDRVEVVRGSGATLFGRAAGAGAVNLISKTGGDKLGGTVSVSRFNNVVGDDHKFAGDLDFRSDFNLNGPIGEKVKFSVGGFLMQDSGFKEYSNKDSGRQLSGNVEFAITNAINLRLYGLTTRTRYNNITDVPWDVGRGQLAEGWSNENSFYPDAEQLDFESTLVSSVFAPAAFRTPILDVDGNEIKQNQAELNGEDVRGNMGGLTLDIDLGGGFTLVEKFRMQAYKWNDHNEITFSSFYGADDNILRLNANSQGNISDIVNETRLQYELNAGNSKHFLSAGVYYSSANYDRFGGLHWYTSNVSPRPTYGWFGPPGTAPLDQFTLSGTTSHQEESVLSFFIGDEMVFAEKLSINVGVRYDQMTGYFNNDPEEVAGVDYDPAELVENELDFSDFSGSIGANYLIAPRTAVYGSFVRAFSLPSVGLATPLPEKNEIVLNTELGFRFGVGDFGFDIGGYNTVINNRVASVFNPNATTGQTFIAEPVGKNTVRGAEFQLTYAPTLVKGLLIRSALTLQQSQYDGLQVPLDKIDHDRDPETPMIVEADLDNLMGLDLVELDATNDIYAIDVTGNQVQNTPTTIFTLNANYNSKYFGIGYDVAYYGGRYATALNLIETPDFVTHNATAFGRYPLKNGSAIKLGLRIKNLLNSANVQQIVVGSANDTELIQAQKTPDFTDVLAFGTVQIPRRVLLTLSYDF